MLAVRRAHPPDSLDRLPLPRRRRVAREARYFGSGLVKSRFVCRGLRHQGRLC